MTTDERHDVDTCPDWTDSGQIVWFLEQRAEANELAAGTDIANALRVQPLMISWTLRRLAEDGRVASRKVGRRELWGTPEHLQRLRTEEFRQQRRAEAQREAASGISASETSSSQKSGGSVRKLLPDAASTLLILGRCSALPAGGSTRRPLPQHAES